MSEKEKTGLNPETAANAQEQAKDQTSTNGNVNNGAETSEKTTNPLDVLKAQAKELGLGDEVEVMTKQQLQSYVDSVVAKAIKTREENIRKQQEIEEMKKKGQFEELLKTERKTALEDLKVSYLQAKGLNAELGALIATDGLANMDLMSAKNELTKRVDDLAAVINNTVEMKVKERIKELEAGSYKQSTNTIQGSAGVMPTSPEEFSKLSYTEQARIFKENPELYKQLTNGG